MVEAHCVRDKGADANQWGDCANLIGSGSGLGLGLGCSDISRLSLDGLTCFLFFGSKGKNKAGHFFQFPQSFKIIVFGSFRLQK